MAAAGGGIVHIPRGRYVSGVIRMKSGVELNIHEEAVLLASTNRADYGPSSKASAWIVADSAKNIALTGKGLLDGQSDLLIADTYNKLRSGELHDTDWKKFNPWHQRRPTESNRPRMIRFSYCDSVRVQNLRMQNGTSWIQDYRNCSNMLIEGINVFSNTFLNNDGIDLTDCKNALIRNCIVNAADDGICLKSSQRNSNCENIVITNCRVRSSASAIKLGTASHGGFKNIIIRNIEVYDTYRSAIAIEAVDGGTIENVDVRDIRALNTGNAIFIRLGKRNDDAVISQLKNIYIGNVYVEIPNGKPDAGYTHDGPELRYPSGINNDSLIYGKPLWYHHGIDSTAKKYRHNVFPSSITGIPGHPVENVTLENIKIVYEGGFEKNENEISLDEIHRIPEVEKEYPEFSMFGELPAWGFYIRHAKGVVMKNVELVSKKPDRRIPVLVHQVQSIHLSLLKIPNIYSTGSVFFKETEKITLTKMKGQIKNKIVYITK